MPFDGRAIFIVIIAPPSESGQKLQHQASGVLGANQVIEVDDERSWAVET